MIVKRWSEIGLLTLIPVFIILSIQFRVKTTFQEGRYDPDYIYMINGLNLAMTGRNIGHIDHPGTPVQMISAVVIRSIYLFRNTNESLQTDLLLHPEFYLERIAWFFTIANVLLIFLCGLLVLKITGNIGNSLIFQSMVLIPTVMASALYRDCPETVLFGASSLFAVFILRESLRDEHQGSHSNLTLLYYGKRDLSIFSLEKPVLLIALLLGFLLATKINALPLILLPLIFIEKKRNKTAFLIFVMAAFILFTLPIKRYYSEFFSWTTNLFFHSDYYGRGPRNIINPFQAWKNFLTIMQQEPLVLIIILVSTFFAIFRFHRQSDRKVKILLALVIIQWLDILIVIKHFRLHYLIPVIPLLAVNMILIFSIIRLPAKIQFIVMTIIVSLFFAWNFSFEKELKFNQKVVHCPNCINIYAFGSNSMFYGLKLGDGYAKNLHGEALEKLYGPQYFYNYWTGKVVGWQKEIAPDSLLLSNREIYFYTQASFLHKLGTPFVLDSVSPGRYKVTGVAH